MSGTITRRALVRGGLIAGARSYRRLDFSSIWLSLLRRRWIQNDPTTEALGYVAPVSETRL